MVGWSYGALVAAHWAERNPERAMAAVLVDGAFPYDWLDDAMEQRIRSCSGGWHGSHRCCARRV